MTTGLISRFFHADEWRILQLFSYDQLINFVIFCHNRMSKFTIFLPTINWQIFRFFSLWPIVKFHIIFHNWLANFAFSICDRLKKFTMFFSLPIGKNSWFFPATDEFWDFYLTINQEFCNLFSPCAIKKFNFFFCNRSSRSADWRNSQFFPYVWVTYFSNKIKGTLKRSVCIAGLIK